MNNPQPNEPHTSTELPGVGSIDSVFTAQECETIRDFHQQWSAADGKMTAGNSRDDSGRAHYRVCTVYTPTGDAQRDAMGWVTDRVIDVLQSVNEGHYKFDIQALIEVPSLMRYDAGDQGHYDYHLDIGRKRPNCWRKLSYSVFLNDGFEGGELEFLTGEDLIQHKGPVGTLVVFPSYILHRVNVVTSGTRWALVGWAHGGSFR